MKFEKLAPFETIPYFTIESVRQVWDSAASDQAIRIALWRWSKAGQLIALKKGVYMHARFFERHGGDADFPAAVSAILVPHSYISLEYVLQRQSILTEATYPITAITTQNTRVIQNRLGVFDFRHIKPGLYSGYEIQEYYGVRFARAMLAKALFDYLYLRPWSGVLATFTNLADELRLNLDEMPMDERQAFRRFVIESELPKMHKILHNFEATVWRL